MAIVRFEGVYFPGDEVPCGQYVMVKPGSVEQVKVSWLKENGIATFRPATS